MFYSGPPGEKARLISEEGGVCQSANLSIGSTKFVYTKILTLTLTFKVATVKAMTVPIRTRF